MDGNHFEIIKQLLEKSNANPCVINSEGFSALNWAAFKGYSALVEILLNYSSPGAFREADIAGFTPLHSAAKAGQVHEVKALFKARKPKNEIDRLTPRNDTALSLAVKEGQTKMASLLIERGANLYYTNYKGDTLLDLALEKENLNMIQLLLQAFSKNKLSQTANLARLYLAAKKGDIQTVTTLLQNMTLEERHTLRHLPFNQYSPCFIAIKNKQFEVANILLKEGAIFPVNTLPVEAKTISEKTKQAKDLFLKPG